MYTHFVYTVPHIARSLFQKEILYLLQSEERCTHILYTARVAYFKGNSVPTTVRGAVLKEILQLKERCTHILYAPFLI